MRKSILIISATVAIFIAGQAQAGKVKFEYQLANLQVRILLEGPDIVEGQSVYSSADLSDYSINMITNVDNQQRWSSYQWGIIGDFEFRKDTNGWWDNRWEFSEYSNRAEHTFSHYKQGNTHYVSLVSESGSGLIIEDTNENIQRGWQVVEKTNPPIASAYEIEYLDVDLSDTGTYNRTELAAVNDAGQILGTSHYSGNPETSVTAFIYQDGQVIPIPPKGRSGHILGRDHAYGISENGIVAGKTTTPWDGNYPRLRAFRWANGSMSVLPYLGFGEMVAEDVNDNGDAVGWYSTDNGNYLREAFIWNNGNMVTLGYLPGGNRSEALAINNAGEVVGRSTKSGPGGTNWHAFHWKDGVMTEIAPGAWFSEAVDINESGQIVGTLTDFDGVYNYEHGAFIYEDGAVIPLGPIDGEVDGNHFSGGINYSRAAAINNLGQITGRAYLQGGGAFIERAFLWDNGYMYNLDDMLSEEKAAVGTTEYVWQPSDINSSGVVLSIDSDYNHMVIRPKAPITVAIDVLPDDSTNTIDPDFDDPIEVAFLSTNTGTGESLDFDATQIDPGTLRFGPAGAAANAGSASTADIDSDGDTDLSAVFQTFASDIVCDDTSVSVSGLTLNGQAIQGQDAISTDCDSGGCHP